MSKNNDYTTGNTLDYEYFSKHCKLTAIDLSKKIELENPDLRQQTTFIGKKLLSLVNLKKIMEKECFSSLKMRRNNF